VLIFFQLEVMDLLARFLIARLGDLLRVVAFLRLLRAIAITWNIMYICTIKKKKIQITLNCYLRP